MLLARLEADHVEDAVMPVATSERVLVARSAPLWPARARRCLLLVLVKEDPVDSAGASIRSGAEQLQVTDTQRSLRIILGL